MLRKVGLEQRVLSKRKKEKCLKETLGKYGCGGGRVLRIEKNLF